MKPINYTRIAMDDIHSEARRIALAWMEGWEEWMKTDVRHKVKLASDIQNFAIAYHQHEMEQLNKQVVMQGLPLDTEKLSTELGNIVIAVAEIKKELASRQLQGEGLAQNVSNGLELADWILKHKRSVFLEADISHDVKKDILKKLGYSSDLLH